MTPWTFYFIGYNFQRVVVAVLQFNRSHDGKFRAGGYNSAGTLGEGVLVKEIYRGPQSIEIMMRSTIVLFVLTFALLGILLGYSSSYSNGNVLVLSTDKPEYKTGETVVFTARNLGSQQLAFPDSALGIRIQNIDTGTVYSLIASQAITYLEVGETKQISWSEGGEGAEPGNYIASIDAAAGYHSVRAEVKFKIT